MSTNFLDRGMRELEYRVIPTGSALQRNIQLAGHVSMCARLESDIQAMEKPHDAIPRNDAYNNLARKLNRHADNPNASSTLAWEKTQKEVFAYFDTRLPVYADPNNGKISSPGYILNTMARTLHYFDGVESTEVCSFLNDPKDWTKILNMFPTLFNPSVAVGMGLVSNYTTLQPETAINLMHLARRLNPNAKFDKFVETQFLPLFCNLAQHAATRALLVKHEDTRTLEQLTADIVREMLGTISGYLTKLGSEGTAASLSEERQELLVNIVNYLNSGNYEHLSESVAKYDSAWVTKTANWFFNNEIDTTLNIIKEMRQSAFLDRALKDMVRQQYGADSGFSAKDEFELQEDPEESLAGASDYEFESHIVDFESSAEEVDAMWESCRVTKDAFSASLTAMSERLSDLQEASKDVELPPIPLAQDLHLEEGDSPEKTVIEHIQDSIARFQEKVTADKSKTKKSYYQADCASLQNSINKILAYQFVGESTFMLTEEQRGVYNEVGSELTSILNGTEKRPKKDLEVMSSVTPVREEIHRLIAFHNQIREQLTSFQKDLRSIDQGTFYNDIQKFVAKGAALDTKQQELQALLDALTNCQDVTFNVLAPENEWQRTVCETVSKLNESGTELVDTLQDLLLYQQNQSAADDAELKPREYKKVSPKKDTVFSKQFPVIMEEIQNFAETLQAREASRLGAYFEPSPAILSSHGISMFNRGADSSRNGHGQEHGRHRGLSLGSDGDDA